MASSTWEECAGSWPCVWLWPGSSATSASGKDPSQPGRCIFTVCGFSAFISIPPLVVLPILKTSQCKKYHHLLPYSTPSLQIYGIGLHIYTLLNAVPGSLRGPERTVPCSAEQRGDGRWREEERAEQWRCAGGVVYSRVGCWVLTKNL